MIRITPIRLINEENEQVGVVETSDALRMAEEAGLDLVEVSPEARPPVCKIMDYGKYKYEQSKKDQRSRQASKQQEMKEVRLGRSIKVDPHDIQIRVDRARKFLMEGHKVLLVQQFRGREMMHKNLGVQVLQDVVKELGEICKVDSPPRFAGRRCSMVISPDKNRVEAIKRRQAQEAKAAEEDKQAEAGEAAEAADQAAPAGASENRNAGD